jgi:hypothetical protein
MSLEETQVASIAEPVEVETLTDGQRDEWLKGGTDTIPAIETDKKAEPVTIEEKRVVPKQKTPADTEKRFQEILKERKEATARADRLEAEVAELKKGGEKKVEEKKVEAVAEVKEPERPKRPRRPDFSTDELYEAAMDKHEGELLEYPAKKAAFDSAKASFEKQQENFKTRQEKVTNAWKAIADKGRELYSDWDKVAFDANLPIVEHDPIERYLRDSEPEVAAHLLQYLGINRKDLDRISALSSREQFKEMEAIETALREELKLGGKVETKKDEPKPETKKVTAALKPPSEVGGKGTSPEDEEEAALKDGDVDRYIEVANKRDLAARRRGK